MSRLPLQEGEESDGNDEAPALNNNLPQFFGVRMIDWNGIQIPFNEVTHFENEFFKGQVLFMVKTEPEDPRYMAHFAGKQRLFEMQIQGQFKKLPEGMYVCMHARWEDGYKLRGRLTEVYL